MIQVLLIVKVRCGMRGFQIVASVFSSYLQLLQLNAVQVFMDQSMRVWFSGEDEVTIETSGKALNTCLRRWMSWSVWSCIHQLSAYNHKKVQVAENNK